MFKHCLVVGGTSGIGEALAVDLGQRFPQAAIVIAGRNREKAQRICDAAKHKNLQYAPLDASLMKNVKAFCARYPQDATLPTSPIDLLIMSQGIFTTQGRTEVDPAHEKVDQKMALHYYSRMCLVKDLLAHKKLSENATIVSVLDGLRSDANAKSMLFDDLDLVHNYSLAKAAEHCLNMTDVLFDHWARMDEHKQRTFIHAYPGFVATELLTNSPHMSFGLGPILSTISKWVATSPSKCASLLLAGSGKEEPKGILASQMPDHPNRYNLDASGRPVKKTPIKSANHEKLIVEHTWSILDRGQ